VILLAVVSGALSLLVRFHRAAGTERLQLRWVSLAAGLAALVLVAFLASMAAGIPSLPDAGLVGTVCLVILTMGISAATLGYRLYDLDRIISRTLAYGLLTVLLGGGYAAVAVGLSQLASGQSGLTVALATLALAVVFRPARRRVQNLVDRHFNRRRYDAAQTIGAFATRLRQQPDLDLLAADLLVVVDQSMEPAGASLWLAPDLGGYSLSSRKYLKAHLSHMKSGWRGNPTAGGSMPATVQPVIVTATLPLLLAFYKALLGAVEISRVPEEGSAFYVGLQIGNAELGIVADGEADIAAPQRILLNVNVGDLGVGGVESLLKHVEVLGGHVLGPPNDMPWGQRVAHILDPDGNTVNLTEPI
jgi:predicted enzyme related to lactoylglutathione lyase